MLVGRIERGLEYHLVETVTLFRLERNRYMFGMYGIESSAEYRCLHIYDYTISARDIQRIRRMKARSRGNILLMAKFIDKIIFSAAFIVVVYGLSSRYIGETFALALTAAAYVSAALVYLASRVRRDLAKEITPQEMCSYLALMGAEKQTCYIRPYPKRGAYSLNRPTSYSKRTAKNIWSPHCISSSIWRRKISPRRTARQTVSA